MTRFAGLFDSPDDDDTVTVSDGFGRLGEGRRVRRPDPFGRVLPDKRFDDFRKAWKRNRDPVSLFGDRPFALDGGVGADADNRRPDVARLETGLGFLGHLDLDRTEGPTGYPSTRLVEATKNFQRDNGLKVDGLVTPGGPTIRTLEMRIGEGHTGFRTMERPAGEGRTGNLLQRAAAGEPPTKSEGGAKTPGDGASAPKTPQTPGTIPKEVDVGGGRRLGARSSDASLGNWSEASDIPGPEDPSARKLASERRKAILSGGQADFSVAPNPDADSSKPWFALDGFSEVRKVDAIIERKAKQAGIDPDLVRAIVHVETTHGYYDRFHEAVGINKSIRPMNVYAEYWKGLGYDRRDLEKPEKNIEAGVELLREIKARMPDAGPEEIASVYKQLGVARVTDYGARVGRVYRERSWERNR